MKLALVAAIPLLFTTPAWGQLCQPASGPVSVALEAGYGERPTFSESSLRLVLDAARLTLAGEYTARRFPDDDALHAIAGAAAYTLVQRTVAVCPIARVGRQRLSDLEVTLVAAGIELAAGARLADRATLTSWVAPMLAYSRSDIGGPTRVSTDPALSSGALLRYGPVHAGFRWERRFLDGVPGVWQAFGGLNLTLHSRGLNP